MNEEERSLTFTQIQMIYACSDSVGETAETVVQAVIRQFDHTSIRIKRIGHIKHEDEITAIMEEAQKNNGFIAYTLVQSRLREKMKHESIRFGVRAVDIMGPMIQAYVDTFHDSPKQTPGLIHQMDEQYFRRVEAIEFAVKSDDGKDISALLKAQIVLIGISRTSKTPLSIFLAHKGWKVANFPIVPEVQLPKELFKIPKKRIIGLTMDPEQLLRIRSERLRAMGLPAGAQYATQERIENELANADQLFKQIGCPILNVSNKAIEETASLVMDLLQP